MFPVSGPPRVAEFFHISCNNLVVYPGPFIIASSRISFVSCSRSLVWVSFSHMASESERPMVGIKGAFPRPELTETKADEPM